MMITDGVDDTTFLSQPVRNKIGRAARRSHATFLVEPFCGLYAAPN